MPAYFPYLVVGWLALTGYTGWYMVRAHRVPKQMGDLRESVSLYLGLGLAFLLLMAGEFWYVGSAGLWTDLVVLLSCGIHVLNSSCIIYFCGHPEERGVVRPHLALERIAQ